MSISHFRTNKELNSNRSNFAQMSMFFKYSYFLLGENIGSEARLTLFKSQFSHLSGLGIKFGPMKEYVNSFPIANNRQITRFIFSCQTEEWYWFLSLLYNNDNKKSKRFRIPWLTTCPKVKKQEFVGYFCKNTVDKLLGNPNHILTLKVK